MEKYLKYLMLLFVAALSVSFTACGDDDDEPEKNEGTDISMAGKLNTVTVGVDHVYSGGSKDFEKVTVDVGCQIYHNIVDGFGYLEVTRGGGIVYAGDFQNLSSVTTVPKSTSDYRDYAIFYKGGCYVIRSSTGNFIRLKVVNATETSETYQFQTFKPTNL